MASTNFLKSNVSPLKRTFDHIALSAEPISHCDNNSERRRYADRRSLSISSITTNHPPERYTKRRTVSSPVNSMFAQSTTIMSSSFPSFMSVYGNEDNNIYKHALHEHDEKDETLHFSQFPKRPDTSVLDSRPPLIERRSSLTSSASCSTGSSPTTTSSTFDSPLMSDQSPETSPESASSAAPPKSFQQPRTRSAGTQTMDYDQDVLMPLKPTPISASVQREQEPEKNLKKLTLDMRLPSLIRPSIGPEPELQPFSAPTSPLREPLRTGRRKPNNLSIRTPGFNQLSFGSNALAIPATPAQKSLLHQAQSSPSLPSLTSPTLGPAGGMRLTLPSIAQSLRMDTQFNNPNPIVASNLPSLREEPYQPPKSQEAPEQGYTEGPCLIYDSGVYLYLEPNAEEASKFDTVINVAKEIKNPFEPTIAENNTVVSVWRNAGNRQSIIEPQTAMSEISFKSAFEWPCNSDPTTPTTPRPTSSQLKRPEYLHVKWDHNSEILGDLLPLCQLIDDRIRDGKKVLIHCQLGVSRSASLIIAYGLYKGYEPDFHSMYMAVKKRSQWVGPNMSLIYQLTDFKSKCDKGSYAGLKPQPKPEWFVYSNDNARTPIADPIPTKDSTMAPRPESIAESRPVLRLDKELPPIPQPALESQSSALSNLSIKTSPAQSIRPVTSLLNGKPKTAQKAVPRLLPFRAMGYSNQDMAIPPHRPREVPGLTHAHPSMDLAMQDVPAVPSLFSPRATEFMASPFGVTGAGDLVSSTPKQIAPPPGAFPGGTEWRNSLFFNHDTQGTLDVVVASEPVPYDPRSPHQIGETKEFFRNIDGFL